MVYPHNTGHVAHSSTSAASAHALDASGQAKKYDDLILDFLEEVGRQGATAEECRKKINEIHPNFHNGSANANLSKLWKQRRVIKTSYKRETDSGKQAHIYALAVYRRQFADFGALEPEYSQVKPQGATANEERYKRALINARDRMMMTGFGSEHKATFEYLDNALDNK